MMSTVRRALLGLGVAVSLLAGVPACGDEVAVDIAAARALAERGDADAQALLAEAYYFGNAVAQDYVEAARWSRLAAEQGHAVGQALLGEAYFFGNGVTQDYVEAVRWSRADSPRGGVLLRSRGWAGLRRGGPLGAAGRRTGIRRRAGVRRRRGRRARAGSPRGRRTTTASASRRTTGKRPAGPGSRPSRKTPSGRASLERRTTSVAALSEGLRRGGPVVPVVPALGRAG